MFDLKLVNLCDHRMIHEALVLTGSSPSFIGALKATSNKNKLTTFIRAYNDEKGMTNFSKSLYGLTNYFFSGDGNQIIFGEVPVTPSMRFPDNNSELVPANVYYIDYVAVSSGCPRCGGTKVTLDISYNVGGALKKVEGSNKISERVLKALFTTKGNNIYDPDYGSNLQDLIGTEIDDFFAVRLQKEIQDTIAHLIALQQNENLTAAETIVKLSDLGMEIDSINPTQINVLMKIQSGTYEDVSTTLSLQV